MTTDIPTISTPHTDLFPLIVGPQTFKASEKPGYHSAYIAMLVGYTIKLTAVLVLYAYMWSVNKARDRKAAAGVVQREQVDANEGEGGVGDAGLNEEERQRERARQGIEDGMQDMTELDNKNFRQVSLL